MSEQLIQDANRRLNEAAESLREAQQELTQWKQANQGYAVTHPKYLELKEQVNRCDAAVARAQETFNNLTSNRGNCN